MKSTVGTVNKGVAYEKKKKLESGPQLNKSRIRIRNPGRQSSKHLTKGETRN